MRWYPFAITAILSVLASIDAEAQQPMRRPVVLVGGTFSKDWLSFTPAEDACSRGGQDDGYYCLRADHKQYQGSPRPTKTDSETFTPTTRLMAAVEVVLPLNLSIGGRLGYAFGDDAKSADGSGFSRLHAEGRLSVWFLPGSFTRQGFRPFAFLSAGLAQFDLDLGKTSVVEAQDCTATGYEGFCPVVDAGSGQIIQYNPQGQSLDVSYRTHKGFLGFGAGVMFALEKNHGPVFELKASKILSDDAWVTSPGVGYLVGF